MADLTPLEVAALKHTYPEAEWIAEAERISRAILEKREEEEEDE